MTVMPALRTLRLPCLLVLVWGLLACAANPALEESRQAFATRSPELALRELRDKVTADPRNLELRSYYLRQRDMLVARQLALADQARAAGRFEQAEAALGLARQFDPLHPRVAAGYEAIAARQARDHSAREAQRHLDKGDVVSAETAARAVLAADPAHPLPGK